MLRTGLALVIAAFATLYPSATRVEGMVAVRWDPGFAYADKETQGVNGDLATREGRTRLATRIVADAREIGANTLIVNIVSGTYGAFFPTHTESLHTEPVLGQGDILADVLQAANEEGPVLRVFAALPLNGFKSVWRDHPAWRSRARDGSDYQPPGFAESLLSTWDPSYRNWMNSLIHEIVTRYPRIAGIEFLYSPPLPTWDNNGDFHPAAVQEFSTSKSGESWERFRSRGFSDLFASAARIAKLAGRSVWVSFPWAMTSKGDPLPPQLLAEESGFDAVGLANLPPSSRPDGMFVEVLWQQWLAEHGRSQVFNPGWTAKAFASIRGFFGDTVPLFPHVEPTPWQGTLLRVVPLPRDFLASLDALRAAGFRDGISVYDINQLSRFVPERRAEVAERFHVIW